MTAIIVPLVTGLVALWWVAMLWLRAGRLVRRLERARSEPTPHAHPPRRRGRMHTPA